MWEFEANCIMVKVGLVICYNDKIAFVGCMQKSRLNRHIRINSAVCCHGKGGRWRLVIFVKRPISPLDVGRAEHLKEYAGLTSKWQQ
jgi:hypothetical protein